MQKNKHSFAFIIEKVIFYFFEKINMFKITSTISQDIYHYCDVKDNMTSLKRLKMYLRTGLLGLINIHFDSLILSILFKYIESTQSSIWYL